MNPEDILAQIITSVKFMGMRKIEGLILPPSGQRNFTGMEDTEMIFEGTESPEGLESLHVMLLKYRECWVVSADTE